MCNWDLMRTAQHNYLAPFRKHVLSLHSNLRMCACVHVCVCTCAHTCLCLGKFLQPTSLIFFNIYLFVWLCQVLVVTHRIFDIWHVGCLAVESEVLVGACGIQFPDQGSNPGPLHWEYRVLTTAAPAKSQKWLASHSTSWEQCLIQDCLFVL